MGLFPPAALHAATSKGRTTPCTKAVPTPSVLPIFNMPVPSLWRRRTRFSSSALVMPHRSSSALHAPSLRLPRPSLTPCALAPGIDAPDNHRPHPLDRSASLWCAAHRRASLSHGHVQRIETPCPSANSDGAIKRQLQSDLPGAYCLGPPPAEATRRRARRHSD